MTPKLERMAVRLKELIKEADVVISTTIKVDYSTYIGDLELLNEWIMKTQNILALIFGINSIQYKRAISLIDNTISYPDEIKELKGILKGCLNDFENGFVVGQEFIIAGEIFESVIEESKHLLKTNHKDASAVLARVVVEDSLKRIARNIGISHEYKASRINDELRKIGIYSQPQWRLIQSWLDIGNAAAHGEFEIYTEDDVRNMLNGVEQFLASDIFK